MQTYSLQTYSLQNLASTDFLTHLTRVVECYERWNSYIYVPCIGLLALGPVFFYSSWFYKFDVNFIHTMRELRKQKSTIQHLGSWTLDPGPSIQDPEPWIPDPWSILGPGSRITDPGSRMVDPGSRILGPAWIHHSGSRILDPGSKVCVLYELFCVFVYIQKMRMRMVNGDRTI